MLVSLCASTREAYAQIGLGEPTQDDSRLQTLFRCLLSLPLLPVDEVRPGFEDVKVTLDDQSPAKSLMQQLEWESLNESR